MFWVKISEIFDQTALDLKTDYIETPPLGILQQENRSRCDIDKMKLTTAFQCRT